MNITFVVAVLAAASLAACDPPIKPAADGRPVDPSPAAPVVAGGDTARVAPQHPPSEDLEFEAVLDLKQDPPDAAGQLRGGAVARSADWPASLYVTFSTPDGQASCTAALLGPKAMLTAAHCVPASGRVRFAYTGHPQPYKASCTRHPRYPADPSADFALCAVTPAFSEPAGFQYEAINASAMNTMLKKQVILTGYGCVSDVPGVGGFDRKYRIGGNSIDDVSEGTNRRRGPSYDAYFTPAEVNNLFTVDDPGTANLCPGDSGGPAFMRSSGGIDTFANRRIIGVNSRVFYRNSSGTQYGSSLISSTGGPDFLEWATDWAKSNGDLVVCGVAGLSTKCRS